MDIEKVLQTTDFSKHSKVKESLRQKILLNRNNELSLDELDMITAAGAVALPPKEDRI